VHPETILLVEVVFWGEWIVRNRLFAAGFAASVALIGLVLPAGASTYQVTFAASDFNFTPTPTPVVLGQIDVTFDPAASAGTLANGPATLDFLNFNVTNVGYFYNGFTDELALGGIVVPGDIANGMAPGNGHDDFEVWISSFSTAPTFSFATYFTTADPLHIFTSQTGAVHVDVSQTLAATPIPATLPLFVSALGGIGFLGWRRRKSDA
jgi:hypothetical protein